MAGAEADMLRYFFALLTGTDQGSGIDPNG
jgi:hypothetical protein